MNQTTTRIRRAQAVLSMGENLGEAFSCFMVLMDTGPGKGTATTVHGAAMAMGMPFDLIDGLKPVPAKPTPSVLMAAFPSLPTEAAIMELATSATAAAPGSLLVVAVPDSQEGDVRRLRDAAATIPSVLASNCGF